MTAIEGGGFRQEWVRKVMRKEEAGIRAAYRRGKIADILNSENKTPRYQELETELAKLAQARLEVLVKHEFDKTYTSVGASGMNAFSPEDLTVCFITVPANPRANREGRCQRRRARALTC